MPLKRTLPKISDTIKTSDGIVTTERLVILTKNNTSTKLFSTKIDSNSPLSFFWYHERRTSTKAEIRRTKMVIQGDTLENSARRLLQERGVTMNDLAELVLFLQKIILTI